MSTAIEKTQAIVDLLSANLPALLAAYTPVLDNFTQYVNYSPDNDKEKIISVYIDVDVNDVLTKTFGVIIQCQIFGDDQVQEYHSVIMPFLEEFLIGSVVEMERRTIIDGDPWPMDTNSTAFIFYKVMFETELDDCDD